MKTFYTTLVLLLVLVQAAGMFLSPWWVCLPMMPLSCWFGVEMGKTLGNIWYGPDDDGDDDDGDD